MSVLTIEMATEIFKSVNGDVKKAVVAAYEAGFHYTDPVGQMPAISDDDVNNILHRVKYDPAQAMSGAFDLGYIRGGKR